MERNLRNAVNMVNPLHVKVVSGYVKDVLERNLINVSYVIKPLHISEVSKDIKEHTLGRNYKYNKGDKAFASINTLQNPETKLYHRKKKPYKCVAKFWHFMVV